VITSVSEVTNAENLVAQFVANLSNDDIAADSLLPDWSRGHVLSHLANNARGLSNLIEWALTGVQKDMYVSVEQRAIDIENDAKRSGHEIVADFLEQSKIFASNLDRLMAGPILSEEVVLGNGSHVHPHEITTLRERELLVHLVDLGLDYRANDWTFDFSIKTLKSVSAGKRKERVSFRLLIAGDHTWTGDQNGMVDIFGTPQSLAAWLMGREPDDKLVTSDGSPLGKPPLWL
jgi:maleylpyruvate isomerase